METKNKKLRSRKANEEYYSQSDKNFMPLQQSLMAHKVLDRVAWVRKWVHELASQTHIDVATKDGYLPLTLAAEGVECIGIDPSEDAIDEADLKATEAEIDVTYKVAFAKDIPEGVYADTVSALEVLEHVVDPDEFLDKVTSLGRFVMISTPDANGRHGMKDAERNEEHLRMYTKEELEKLLGNYGKIKESVLRDDQICILLDMGL
jgi:2-polyprenyl-3-methyl-5-hydroxy-6-metoxy-1,4-benzoquinol methylase